MKKHFIALAILPSVLLTMVNAQAAPPTAELKVKGSIDVPTCSIAAPNNGVYDLGKLPSSLVAATTTTTLAAMSKKWAVTCDSLTYISVSAVDNRAATASQASSAPTNFGLGYVNGDGKIGYYTASMTNGFVDGVARQIYYGTKTVPVSGTTALGGGYTFVSANHYGWAGTNGAPIAGRVFTADMRIYPVLASMASMKGPLADNAKIDGSMTINFAFAI
jgi:type 1 fimbria pilin